MKNNHMMKKEFYSNLDIQRLEEDNEKLKKALLLFLGVSTKEEIVELIQILTLQEPSENKVIGLIACQTLLEINWE